MKEVIWKFPEFPDTFPVKGIAIEANSLISFVWDPETVVTITLETLEDKGTLIRVNENGKEYHEENLKWALGNTEGWANFLACLKAYLDEKVHLNS